MLSRSRCRTPGSGPCSPRWRAPRRTHRPGCRSPPPPCTEPPWAAWATLAKLRPSVVRKTDADGPLAVVSAKHVGRPPLVTAERSDAATGDGPSGERAARGRAPGRCRSPSRRHRRRPGCGPRARRRPHRGAAATKVPADETLPVRGSSASTLSWRRQHGRRRRSPGAGCRWWRRSPHGEDRAVATTRRAAFGATVRACRSTWSVEAVCLFDPPVKSPLAASTTSQPTSATRTPSRSRPRRRAPLIRRRGRASCGEPADLIVRPTRTGVSANFSRRTWLPDRFMFRSCSGCERLRRQ